MQKFMVKKILKSELASEFKNIGFDEAYRFKALDKYRFFNLKIYDLTLPQANILKQTALSLGADCAVHRDVLISNIEKTDCILGGTISQLKKIANSLSTQQFGLSFLASDVLKAISDESVSETKIVGILNLTQNSFSDGGKYFEFEAAKTKVLKLIEAGADVIDIGAESTKPYSEPVSSDLQLEKILPVLDFIASREIKIPISIDTRSAIVAEKCIENGASIINDVSGLDFDEKMIEIIAQKGVKVVIQHSQGTPQTMQINPVYDNLVDDIYKKLNNKIELSISKGVALKNIIIDLGIGFGKTVEQNFELIRRAEEFKSLNVPIMMGVSRKSFLGADENEIKDVLTCCLNTLLVEQKIDYIRVHNVKMHKKMIEMMRGYNGE